LVEEFFSVLIHILYEIPCPNLPKDLVDPSKKQDLFFFVSPIIAFLIVYWFNCQGKKKSKNIRRAYCAFWSQIAFEISKSAKDQQKLIFSISKFGKFNFKLISELTIGFFVNVLNFHN